MLGSVPRLSATVLACAMLGASAPALAQGAGSEAPDPTRLDVERLPPEAIGITRELFSQGLFVGGELGGRGFAGGAGRIAQPGVLGRVLLGYELTQWLMLAAAAELSLHATDAAAPPAPSSFEVLDAVLQLRLQWPMSARAALFLGAEGGIGWVPGNLLEAYGLTQAGDIGFTYGGSLGFDWHLLSRHHSLGLLAGARLYPNLDGADGEKAIGIHSLAYLKYVF